MTLEEVVVLAAAHTHTGNTEYKVYLLLVVVVVLLVCFFARVTVTYASAAHAASDLLHFTPF